MYTHVEHERLVPGSGPIESSANLYTYVVHVAAPTAPNLVSLVGSQGR